MFDGKGKTKITYSTPEESIGRVGVLFRGGVTLINKKTGDAEIIIDSQLSPELRKVYREHERVQLQVIREEGPRYGESILPNAHFTGLKAGYRKAKELRIEEEYRKHRGERE